MAVIAVAALSAACELIGAWADEKREIPAAVLFVRQPSPGDASGTLPPDGSEARPYPSLHDALAAAPAGPLLRGDDGTYCGGGGIPRAVGSPRRGAGRCWDG